MKLGCGKYSFDEFILNIEQTPESFLSHLELCDSCKKSYTEISIAKAKMEKLDLEGLPRELKYEKIVLKVRENCLEILSTVSGARYGALAFRGEGKREVIYDSENTKIFVDLYESNELVVSVRINDYGIIEILDEQGKRLKYSSGKSGVDCRVSYGKYRVKHGDEELVLEFLK